MPVHAIGILGDSKELFELGIKSVFAAQYENSRMLKGYSISDDKFYLHFHIPYKEDDNFVGFPFPMKEEMAIQFIWEYLKCIKYPKNTYTGDGDTKKGFKIHSNWEGNYVEPFYTIYGK